MSDFNIIFKEVDAVGASPPNPENFRVNFGKRTRVQFRDRFGWGTKTKILLKK